MSLKIVSAFISIALCAPAAFVVWGKYEEFTYAISRHDHAKKMMHVEFGKTIWSDERAVDSLWRKYTNAPSVTLTNGAGALQWEFYFVPTNKPNRVYEPLKGAIQL